MSSRSATSVLDRPGPVIAPREQVVELVSKIEGHADFEFLNCPLSVSADFIKQDPWRVFRIQSDVIQGVDMKRFIVVDSAEKVVELLATKCDTFGRVNHAAFSDSRLSAGS